MVRTPNVRGIKTSDGLRHFRTLGLEGSMYCIALNKQKVESTKIFCHVIHAV